MATTTLTETRPSVATVRKAIAIQGYITMHDAQGREMRIREIEVRRGKWVTDHYTSSMGGRVRVSQAGKVRLTERAQRIIARKDELTAERDRAHRVAMGRD